MESIRLLELEIDVLHANDWPTGLLPAYLKTEYRGQPAYENIASLMTIHNLAYQGVFWHWDMELTGLDWKYFNDITKRNLKSSSKVLNISSLFHYRINTSRIF
jgi:starch synthase